MVFQKLRLLYICMGNSKNNKTTFKHSRVSKHYEKVYQGIVMGSVITYPGIVTQRHSAYEGIVITETTLIRI